MRRSIVGAALAALLIATPRARVAEAAPIPVCTAADVIAADPGCPATGTCTISKIFDASDGCVFDFGVREVRITGTGELRIGEGMVTLKTGNLTVAGGQIDGSSNSVGGGFIRVEADGDIEVGYQPTGKILVNGASRGGTILLDASGDITISGQLKANKNDIGASGGTIELRSGGDVLIAPTSVVDVSGGLQACGGTVDIIAQGRAQVQSAIDSTGGDGGSVSITAIDDIEISGKIQTTGEGDAGSGGCVDLAAGTGVDVIDQIQSRGTGSAIDSGGGCGGAVFIDVDYGDIIIRNEINVKSGPPDGGGGCIELYASGSVDIRPTAAMIAEGGGGDSCGGEILIDASVDVTVGGKLISSGGDAAGDISVDAGRDLTVSNDVDARGTVAGSFGGTVTLEAGVVTPGSLVIDGDVDVSGAACDAFGFCSLGGDVDLVSCTLTTGGGTVVDASAPGSEGIGGTVYVTGRKQLTLDGGIDAEGGTGPLNGSIDIIHPPGAPPAGSGTMSPAPDISSRAVCTGGGNPSGGCLVPCPTCGDGTTDYPETCDDTTGTPQSCDGCSTVCQLEDCDDASDCTVDSCDPLLGCRNRPVPNGTFCGDGDVCNGEEQCLSGLCLSGIPTPDCDDSNPCTQDSCDPLLGCQNIPLVGTSCSDGSVCTVGDTCDGAGDCQPGPPLVCNDGEECTVDSCNPVTGCVFDTVPLLGTQCTDDGDPCTHDICFNTCVHPDRGDGASCEDGDLCTLDDTCQTGVCVGGDAAVCTALDQCHDAGTCNSTTGMCSNPNAPDGRPCDDGDLCTRTDTCQTGQCSGANPIVCTALDQCHDAGVCNAATGVCSNPTRPDGAACEDGDFCTIDTCQGGACTSAPFDCNDSNGCTADSCDEILDMCVNDPITGPCCGDGAVDSGEECDEGENNSDEPNSLCRTDCTMAQCGNGVLDDLLGETCDLGAANSDEPNADCRTDCTSQRCGDGIYDDEKGEQCEDDNLDAGDGCSPRCFIEPPATADYIPGKGSKRTDCVIEWKMDNVRLDDKGKPSVSQVCRDGDPSCDADGMANGECIFHLWVCSNNTDPALTDCTPGPQIGAAGLVAIVTVKKPSARQAERKPHEAEVRNEMKMAAAAAPVGDNLDVCGPRLDIRTRLKSPVRRGRTRIKLRGTTSRNVKDNDTLKLTCLP